MSALVGTGSERSCTGLAVTSVVDRRSRWRRCMACLTPAQAGRLPRGIERPGCSGPKTFGHRLFVKVCSGARSSGPRGDAGRLLALPTRTPHTEPHGSAFARALQRFLRRAFRRDATRRSSTTCACRRVDHIPRRQVRHDPDGHEEACRRSGNKPDSSPPQRLGACGPARSARVASKKRWNGSRSTARSGTRVSRPWTR